MADQALMPAAPAPVEQDAEIVNTRYQTEFVLASRVSIPSAKKQKSVLIDTVELDGETIVETAPYLDQTAYLTAKFTHSGDGALLPGAVMLYRDAMFVGEGHLPFLASGDEHRLGFGVDDKVSVKRIAKHRLKGETGVFSTSDVEDERYLITVENFHDRPVTVRVFDRMPHTDLEDVTVDLRRGGSAPDEKDIDGLKGVVAWNRIVEPGKTSEIEFGFTIAIPDDLKTQRVIKLTAN